VAARAWLTEGRGDPAMPGLTNATGHYYRI